MSFKNLSFMKKTFLVVSLPIIVMVFGFTNPSFFSNLRNSFSATNMLTSYEKVEADTNLTLKPNVMLEKKAALVVSILKREHYKKQNQKNVVMKEICTTAYAMNLLQQIHVPKTTT